MSVAYPSICIFFNFFLQHPDFQSTRLSRLSPLNLRQRNSSHRVLPAMSSHILRGLIQEITSFPFCSFSSMELLPFSTSTQPCLLHFKANNTLLPIPQTLPRCGPTPSPSQSSFLKELPTLALFLTSHLFFTLCDLALLSLCHNRSSPSKCLAQFRGHSSALISLCLLEKCLTYAPLFKHILLLASTE